MIDPYLEVVDATVIGLLTQPYEFWTRDGQQRIGRRRYFAAAAEAEAWFAEHYPDEYRQGVEMRCYDQVPTMPALQLADGTVLDLAPGTTVAVAQFPPRA
ncbi:MAG: hypothetical protein KKA73_09005 [Chloroflexi bacterium]|nr:hypothetical protein [Chloroflexota bacterium]MBU1747816.1 hypothetical protein [Chloroflexota bacterium]